ncbi:MAG: DMT family transporter [Pseudomonadota bacterium]
MNQDNPRLGIALMLLTTFIFAAQDGISAYLAREYNAYLIVMIRYWFFAAAVLSLAHFYQGGIRKIAASRIPKTQFFRGVLLQLEIIVTVLSFVFLGLVEAHAIFAIYPLMIAALSGLVLGESVGWRRWLAIAVGFAGILIILKPGFGVFSPYALIPLLGALMFALYGLLTRYVSRFDAPSTSFFWTGIGGAVSATAIGLFFLEPLARSDWGWMALLCVTGIAGHFTLIKCYSVVEAARVQPFAYFQLVFATLIGVMLFGEALPLNTFIGSIIVVSAGVFALIRTYLSRATDPG